MTTIQLYCRGASAWTKVDGRITRGMVGLNVVLFCDESWDGLTRSLVARNGDGERWVLAVVGDTAVVPHEALQEEGHLYLCLEGRDADGHLVLPSNWASCGRIYDSGGGKPGTAEATPTELQQLMVLADQARRTAEEALRRAGQPGSSSGGGTEGGGTVDLTGYATQSWVNSNFGSKTEVQSAASAAASAGSAASTAQSTANTAQSAAASALAKAQEALNKVNTGGGGGSSGGEYFGPRWKNLAPTLHESYTNEAFKQGDPEFGTYTDYAEANTAIITAELAKVDDTWNNICIYIGAGTYHFKPFTFTTHQGVAIIGVSPTHYGEMPTVLRFHGLQTGDVAIQAGQGFVLMNVAVLGDENDYNLVIQRGRDNHPASDPVAQVKESGSVHATAIDMDAGTCYMDGVTIRNFYTGIHVHTGNQVLGRIWTDRVHTGVIAENDVYITDLHARHNMVAVESRGNLAHFGSLRGDGVGMMLHSWHGGFSCDSIDGDYCINALVQLGREAQDSDGILYYDNVKGFTISSLTGRCCVDLSYAKGGTYTMSGKEGKKCAWVYVSKSASVKGGTIVYKKDNATASKDGQTEYVHPMAELCIGQYGNANLNIITTNTEWATDKTADAIAARHIRIDTPANGNVANNITVNTPYDILNVYQQAKNAMVIRSAFTAGGSISGVQPLVGTTGSVTPNEVKEAIASGRPCSISHTETIEGYPATFVFTGWAASEQFSGVFAAATAILGGKVYLITLQGGTTTNTWETATREIPDLAAAYALLGGGF